MGRTSAPRPSSARTLYRALDELGAAPRPDPQLRPQGPTRSDAPLLLGVLLAKTELDAAVRADPGQEPPKGLTLMLTGYRSMLRAPADETRLRLLSLRLVRSAVEATVDETADETAPDTPLPRAAGDAALAAAGFLDAERLMRAGADAAAVNACLDAAARSLTSADQALHTRPRPPRR
jgi:hypothetical protein